MPALSESARVADFRLEQKLQYEYANLKAIGQLRNRTRYASAKPVAAGSDPVVRATRYLPPLLVRRDPGRSRVTLATMLKNFNGVRSILPKRNIILQ